jgi:hypothetical protein
LSKAIVDRGDLPLSASKETRRFVLEEVFWVPADNCKPKCTSSSHTTGILSGQSYSSEVAKNSA